MPSVPPLRSRADQRAERRFIKGRNAELLGLGQLAPRVLADDDVVRLLADAGDDSAPATEDGAAPEGFDVKGNKDSMKFHEPDGQWYGSTVAEVWFRTAEAAEKAGFVKAGS